MQGLSRAHPEHATPSGSSETPKKSPKAASNRSPGKDDAIIECCLQSQERGDDYRNQSTSGALMTAGHDLSGDINNKHEQRSDIAPGPLRDEIL